MNQNTWFLVQMMDQLNSRFDSRKKFKDFKEDMVGFKDDMTNFKKIWLASGWSYYF